MEESAQFLEVVRPDADKKFNPKVAESLMRSVIREELSGKAYDHMYASDWTRAISRGIHDKLRELQLERYKFAVQVVVGEDRGQGEKYAGGCLWDEETDGQAVALFTAKTIYCVAVVFAVYSYVFR